MAIVDNINYILKTDRVFTLIAKFANSEEPKDLSAFVGASGDGLQLYLEGNNGDIILSLDDSTDGRLQVLSAAAGLAGKVQVTFKDAIDLRAGDGRNMELRIKEGAGPDFDLSCVPYEGKINVKEKLFE